VESATFGSKFQTVCTATVLDLHFTLRMLGVPVDGPYWLFGENQSAGTRSMIPHHNALSYNRVHEVIAAQVMYILHVEGKQTKVIV
jgi:hypothetical protein